MAPPPRPRVGGQTGVAVVAVAARTLSKQELQ